ncbi:MAG: DnaJ domain-containing protein [Candidatus Sedimenticola sp. (ex Thyasira tokunagai)]
MGKKKKSHKPLKDYYSILGVMKNASLKEIRKKFRKSAQDMHPDRNPSPEATAKFKELGEAYRILKSDKKRNDYDAEIISEYCDTLLGGSFRKKNRK